MCTARALAVRSAVLAASMGVGGLVAGCGGGGGEGAPSAAAARDASPSSTTVGTAPAPSSTGVTAAPTDTGGGGQGTGSGVIIAGGEVRINGSVVQSGGVDAPGTIVGSGVVVTESRPVSGFRAVEVRGAGAVDVQLGAADGLEIEADDNVLAHVRAEVVGDRLVLGLQPGTSLRNVTLRFRVTATALDEVSSDGSADLRVDGLAADAFALHVNGSGDAELAGTATALSIDVEGSGEVDAGALVAQRAAVTVSGSGDVVVHATESLDATIQGSGDIAYRGNPATVTRDVAGSGDVHPD